MDGPTDPMDCADAAQKNGAHLFADVVSFAARIDPTLAAGVLHKGMEAIFFQCRASH